MIETFELLPGVFLRCFPDDRFKQSCLSIQLVRPMDRREAALNALLPAVLLRGTCPHPDLRSITLHLDDLYGASVGSMVRRVGDYQTTGLYCAFTEDAYALPGDRILEPVTDFIRELLLEPLTEKGCFLEAFVESEKKNLLAAIDAQRNDKRSYAASRLYTLMCPEDSYGIPRLGEGSQVRAITAQSLWDHYQRILRESRIDIFYVGSAAPRRMAALLTPLFADVHRNYVNLPDQTPYCPAEPRTETEAMDVSQGKLCMGFTTSITLRDPGFAAMQVCNMILGGSMNNKLFMTVREKLSLCYDIASAYHGSKGIMIVSAGLDPDKYDTVVSQVLEQLALCAAGQITQQELQGAKQALISQLQGLHDSPGSIENYYGTSALSGLTLSRDAYLQAVQQVTLEEAAQAAATIRHHSTYFLKGVLP